jgi:SagB-type dehydrogenase family enzyme
MLVSPGFAAEEVIKLPQPSLKGDVSIEQALASRRSLRTYADTPVTLEDLSQLLWAAQGITDPEKGFRTAPSGMASYPLTVYAACFNITGLPQGIYRYKPDGHTLTLITAGDTRDNFKRQSGPPAAEGRGASTDAPAASESTARTAGHADATLTATAVFVITTDTKKSFASSGYYLEAGHVAQNIVLQCVPLNMGGVTMAGFNADNLKKAMSLPEDEAPVYVIPVGKK